MQTAHLVLGSAIASDRVTAAFAVLDQVSAARRAERGPSPGNFARSWMSRSISTPAVRFISEGQLHARGGHAPVTDFISSAIRASLLAFASAWPLRSSLREFLSRLLSARGIHVKGRHGALAGEGYFPQTAAGLARECAASNLACMSAIWMHGLDCFIMSPRFFIILFHWFQSFGIAHVGNVLPGKRLRMACTEGSSRPRGS